MKKISICLILLAAIPMAAGADNENSGKGRLPDLRGERKEERQEVRVTNTKGRDDDKRATGTKLRERDDDDKKRATGTDDRSAKKELKDDVKEKMASSTRRMIGNYATAMDRAIASRIRKADNIIDRLTTGTSSIMARLEAAGTDVTSIRAKLTEAKASLDKATTNLNEARDLVQTIIGQTATSTPTRANYMAIRAAFRTAANDYKLAYQQLVAGRKLLKEIPGVNSLGAQNGRATTSLDR